MRRPDLSDNQELEDLIHAQESNSGSVTKVETDHGPKIKK